MNNVDEIKRIVTDGDARFLKVENGLVYFFDTLTRQTLTINTASISVNSVRHKLITHRENYRGLKFKIQVYLTDAIVFLFRAHNIPKRVAVEAAIAASEIITDYLKKEKGVTES
jgi:hypothetical protein